MAAGEAATGAGGALHWRPRLVASAGDGRRLACLRVAAGLAVGAATFGAVVLAEPALAVAVAVRLLQVVTGAQGVHTA